MSLYCPLKSSKWRQTCVFFVFYLVTMYVTRQCATPNGVKKPDIQSREMLIHSLTAHTRRSEQVTCGRLIWPLLSDYKSTIYVTIGPGVCVCSHYPPSSCLWPLCLDKLPCTYTALARGTKTNWFGTTHVVLRRLICIWIEACADGSSGDLLPPHHP